MRTGLKHLIRLLLAGVACSAGAAYQAGLPQPPQSGLNQWLDGPTSARTGSDVSYAGPVYISFDPTTGRIRNVQTYEAPLTGSSLNLLELYNGVIK